MLVTYTQDRDNLQAYWKVGFAPNLLLKKLDDGLHLSALFVPGDRGSTTLRGTLSVGGCWRSLLENRPVLKPCGISPATTTMRTAPSSKARRSCWAAVAFQFAAPVATMHLSIAFSATWGRSPAQRSRSGPNHTPATCWFSAAEAVLAAPGASGRWACLARSVQGMSRPWSIA